MENSKYQFLISNFHYQFPISNNHFQFLIINFNNIVTRDKKEKNIKSVDGIVRRKKALNFGRAWQRRDILNWVLSGGLVFVAVLALFGSVFLIQNFQTQKALASPGPGDWLSGWQYRKKITIDSTKIDADLTDFPVLVKLTSSNFDFSKARSDGFDIRFTDEGGLALLKYERERHDLTNQVAEYWVKIL